MTSLSIFLISFGLIFTAELGDKTQLMILTLALRYGGRPVLLGAFCAFTLLSGSAAIIGTGFAELLSPEVIRIISGSVFILFGLFVFLMGETVEGNGREIKRSDQAGILAAFSLIAISELGDKTQIATLLLSVKYQNFYSVFLGSLAALCFATIIGIFVAGRLQRFLPKKYITRVSGFLFLIIGAITLIMK